MRAGPIEDGPPPPSRYRLRSPISRALAELQPGKSRAFEVPAGMTANAAQIRLSHRAIWLWGRGGHITAIEDGGRTIRVWRLTEDQRIAYLAARRRHQEGRQGG